MFFYSIEEILLMLLAAIVIDWIIGDPRWLSHPVINIGRLIQAIEKLLHQRGLQPAASRFRGAILTTITISLSFAATLLLTYGSYWIHPWFGYGMSVWLISTTIAIKGLKDAALLVYYSLKEGNLREARKYLSFIVGRDTDELPESEITRATVETVAENTVDAIVSPLLYALLGGAPLAMLYRASNTLDSMVGYKNQKYLHFGWASARFDDLLNWLPARLTGIMLVIATLPLPKLSALRAWKSIWVFAGLHPSPNSGIPESAVAGALGVQLGGRNQYGGNKSERARMGWPLRNLNKTDILQSIFLIYMVSFLWAGGLLCAYFLYK